MARIAGVDLPRNKRAIIGLTYIYGVGSHLAGKALDATNVDHSTRIGELTETEVLALRAYIENEFQVEGDLRRDVAQNIKRKVEIGCYQGIRHRRGLPVRGQRTHTNARTRKGPKRTVGGMKKKAKK